MNISSGKEGMEREYHEGEEIEGDNHEEEEKIWRRKKLRKEGGSEGYWICSYYS